MDSGKSPTSSTEMRWAMGRSEIGIGFLAFWVWGMSLVGCQSQSPRKPSPLPESGEKKEPDNAALVFIREELYPNGAWKEFGEDLRRYATVEFDLDGSGSDEIILAIPTMNHCGSGGCRIWILNSSGSMVSTSSVVDFPIGIAKTAHEGWRDLYTWSNRAHRVLRFDGNSYPPNASLADTISEANRSRLTELEVLGRAFEEWKPF